MLNEQPWRQSASAVLTDLHTLEEYHASRKENGEFKSSHSCPLQLSDPGKYTFALFTETICIGYFGLRFCHPPHTFPPSYVASSKGPAIVVKLYWDLK